MLGTVGRHGYEGPVPRSTEGNVGLWSCHRLARIGYSGLGLQMALRADLERRAGGGKR